MHKALNYITTKAGKQFKTHINKEKVRTRYSVLVCRRIMSKCNIAGAERYEEYLRKHMYNRVTTLMQPPATATIMAVWM